MPLAKRLLHRCRGVSSSPIRCFSNFMLQVLANNTDLNSARIAVEKSEASLKAAKMAYLPSLYFSPSGTIASFDNSAATKTYNLPLQLSWDIDVFGSITNKKRAAKAVLLQAQMRQEAVRANLISTTAQQYFMLQVLDSHHDGQPVEHITGDREVAVGEW